MNADFVINFAQKEVIKKLFHAQNGRVDKLNVLMNKNLHALLKINLSLLLMNKPINSKSYNSKILRLMIMYFHMTMKSTNTTSIA